MNLLPKFKEIGAVQEGDFILKSGKRSKIYYDLKKVYGEPKLFKKVVSLLSKKIPKGTTCIAGSGNGGVPWATALSVKLNKHLVVVRDVDKKHGIKKDIDGHIPTKKDKVVIVDDVISEGTSLRNTISKLNRRTNILKCLVIIKKKNPKGVNCKVESLLDV